MKISKKRAEPVKETQMVSLADIAFLIIFFFFLSSQFMKDRTQIALPKIPRAAETQAQLTVSMDAVYNIKLNGDPITEVGILELKLHELLTGKSDPKDCEVRFKCDQSVPYIKYRPVYEAISNAGGIIAIMHDVK